MVGDKGGRRKWRQKEEDILTIKHFVLTHAIRVPVTTEADYHKPLFFGHYGLINVPSCNEMR